MSTRRKQSSRMPIGSFSQRHEETDPLHLTANFSEDTTEEPGSLARPLSRRERFFKLGSTVTYSTDTFAEGPPSARSVIDQVFEHEIMEGLNHRVAARSTQVLKDRVKGTMKTKREDGELPDGSEDIRPRHEHIQRRLVEVPSVIAEDEGLAVGSGLMIVRKAMLEEVRDLYKIVSSFDARKFDVCASDVRLMFEWYGTFENFIRVYFMASEKEIYGACDIDEWGKLEGVVGGEKRRREKKRIIEQSDKVEWMKRTMLAADKLCGKHVAEMRRRVDDLTKRLVEFLNEEVRQVPEALSKRFSAQAMESMFHSMIKEMRNSANGRDMLILVSRGAGSNSSEMTSWVRNMCGSTARVSVATWIRKLGDRHMNYATMFEKAENEYIEMYEGLSVHVMEDVGAERKNTRRKRRG